MNSLLDWGNDIGNIFCLGFEISFSAATAVAMTRSLVIPKTLTFDRPFLFLVYDNVNKVLLFCAKVEDVK